MGGEARALGWPDLQVPCSPDTHVTDTHTRRHMVDTTRALSENIRVPTPVLLTACAAESEFPSVWSVNGVQWPSGSTWCRPNSTK